MLARLLILVSLLVQAGSAFAQEDLLHKKAPDATCWHCGVRLSTTGRTVHAFNCPIAENERKMAAMLEEVGRNAAIAVAELNAKSADVQRRQQVERDATLQRGREQVDELQRTVRDAQRDWRQQLEVNRAQNEALWQASNDPFRIHSPPVHRSSGPSPIVSRDFHSAPLRLGDADDAKEYLQHLRWELAKDLVVPDPIGELQDTMMDHAPRPLGILGQNLNSIQGLAHVRDCVIDNVISRLPQYLEDQLAAAQIPADSSAASSAGSGSWPSVPQSQWSRLGELQNVRSQSSSDSRFEEVARVESSAGGHTTSNRSSPSQPVTVRDQLQPTAPTIQPATRMSPARLRDLLRPQGPTAQVQEKMSPKQLRNLLAP